MRRKFILNIAILSTVLFLAQCASPRLAQKPLPPGQAKKVAGQQSAKEFAPGQQKKAAGQQSAKEFAPGQQKKAPATNGKQATSNQKQADSSQKATPPGQAKKKGGKDQ